MAGPRVHITGAACTGTTTLGHAVARALGVVHLDTDDFYWQASDPPYTKKYLAAERFARLAEAAGAGAWVISGALDGWGDPLAGRADLIVFLTAPTPLRLARLKARERHRFGARIEPGGDMEDIHAGFLVWAAQYDDAGFTGRTRLSHEAWLADQTAPVLRLDAQEPVDTLTTQVLARLAQIGYRKPD